jgi:exonuclease VII large subunit
MTKSNDHLTITPLDEALPIGEEGRPTSRVLRTIAGHHLALTQQLADYYDRRKSWLARIFPTQLDRILMDSQLRQARSECELNERILQLACTMKYEACREVAEVWVKSMRVETRETFFRFVAERTEVLQETIERHRHKFAEQMRARYQNLESYRSMPEFQARYKKSIDEEIESHLSWLDELLGRFRAIVQERVAQYETREFPRR